MSAAKQSKRLSPARALRRFGFRQTLRGALIIGALAGLMMGAQGAAFAEAYPDAHSRAVFAASLQGAPAFGFIAGETANISTPASYSVYKSIAIITIASAVWGLLVTTRLLRGQEEDGRLEPIIAGSTTKRQASLHILIGFGYSIAIACLLAFIGIAGLGADPKVNLSIYSSTLLVAGVFLPALFFASVGIVTSQLAVTKQRATLYGLVPLLVLFAVRGAGNSVTDLNWLKQFTPFGWTDLLNPVLDPSVIWLLPTLLIASSFAALGIYLAGRRDLGESLIPQSDVARSHFYLLKSPVALALRQNIAMYVWWGIGAIAFTVLLTAVTNIAANALTSSPVFLTLIAKNGGSVNDIKIAFIGFGALFTAIILLVMSTVSLGSIRHDEAKGYLDNLLVQPVKRSVWLSSRLATIVAAFTVISLICAYATWQVAGTQGITISLATMLQGAISLVGTVVLTLGVGAFLYGFFPRAAVLSMYVIIVWAFIVDILKSLFTLDDFVSKTSLFYYISFSPTKEPDWSTFAWLVCIGVVLAAIGIFGFTKRDIVTE